MKPKPKTQLDQLQRLIREVDRVSADMDVPPPGEFLATVMAGRDPRDMDSPLYTLVQKIALRAFQTGQNDMPEESEWAAIKSLVLETDHYRQARVSIEQSIQAATKLMEYLHAKMKAVEMTGGVGVQLDVKPLTGDDVKAFKERFEDEF